VLFNNFKKLPAIFFDRDGVITIPVDLNGKGFAPRNLNDFKFYNDAKDSLLRTRAAGFFNVVVSNQPDVSSGLLSLNMLESMNTVLRHSLALDEVINCPHNSSDHCLCRKPKPGMIYAAAEKFGIDLSHSWIVGDRDGDIAAGSSAGLKTIFIDRNWLEETGSMAKFKCKSLKEAVDLIITGNF